MNWEDRLIKLFDDSLLDDVRPESPPITANDRLSSSFLEILDWIDINRREPINNPDDFRERSMLSRLDGLRNNEEKRSFLKHLDRYNLL